MSTVVIQIFLRRVEVEIARRFAGCRNIAKVDHHVVIAARQVIA